MNAPDLILVAFREMCDSLANNVGSDFMPHQFHPKRGVAEANSLYYFLKALKSHLPNPRVYLEFSINEGYIDAIVASQAYLFVVEAKATIFGGTASGIFGSLEKQASRMAEPNSSLRTNLTERIIEKFRGDEWGRCSMTEAWGVLIADTLNLNRKSGQPPACPPAVEKWRHLQTSDLPTLQLYKTEVQEDSRLKEWWHLLGFTKLDALSEHV